MNIYNVRQELKTRNIFDLNLRVAYYARVSTDKEEQKNSIVNQRSHFEDLIRSNESWQFSGAYIDDGISGIHAEKREEFQRMLDDARKGKMDLIITKEISRFARNTLDSIQYTRELLSYGVCVWFQNDNINTIDDDSEFRLTIMAGVAQDEVRKLSSRVRFGHAQAIKNGVVLGNSHIYGYDKEKGKLTINPKEAEMIRLIFNKYAYEDYSTPKIEKLLYSLGYRNYKGGKIDRGVIRHIIQNPKYKGYYAGGKVKIIDMFTKKQEFLPSEEWHMYKDDGTSVPAIVDEKTWEVANAKFQERSEAIKTRRTSFKNGNLFTGKIFCGNDGAAYWMKQHTVRGKEDVKWVCSHRIRNGAESCHSFGVSERELQCMIADILNETAINIEKIAEDYINIYKKILSKPNDDEKKIERILNEIALLRAKMEKILDYNLKELISDEEFIKRNTEYGKQVKTLEEELTSLQKKPDDAQSVSKKLNSIAEMIKRFGGVSYEDVDRNLVDNMLEKIVISPTDVRKANIEFFLKNGGLQKAFYGNSEGCSDDMVKKMIEAQEKQMAGK